MTGKERRITTRSKDSGSPLSLIMSREISPPPERLNFAFSGVSGIETRSFSRIRSPSSEPSPIMSFFGFLVSGFASGFFSAVFAVFSTGFSVGFAS